MVREIQNVDLNSYNEEIKEGLVLVDAFASWCGPCKMLAPVLNSVSEDEEMSVVKFIKFSVETHKELARDLDIKSIPTLILYSNGTELKRISGYMPKKEIIEWIKPMINVWGK